MTRLWSSKVSLPQDLQHPLDHEHHVRTAGVVFVEHQGDMGAAGPGQNPFTEFGDLLAVLQHDGVLADQVDAADVAVEIDPDQGQLSRAATCSMWVDLPVP